MMDVALFRKLFVYRDDTYAVQTSKKRDYKRVSAKLTDKTIQAHLDGKETIGLYQLLNGKVKWACIDIDIVKAVWSQPGFNYKKDWSAYVGLQASHWKQKLADDGITSYLEDSGNKGAHIWILFEEPMPAAPIRSALNSISTSVPKVSEGIEWEIFPKQDSGDLGGLVKGPNGYHQAGGRYSQLIDSVDDPVYVPWASIIKHTNPHNAIFEGCEALNVMVNNGLTSKHLGHTERLDLSYIFSNLGDSGKAYIKDKVYKHLSDYDENITDKNLDNVTHKGYKPITCAKLQEHGICPGKCDKIGASLSPIVFYNRAIGKPEEDDPTLEEIDAVNPLDRFFRKSNAYYEKTINSRGEPMTVKISNFVIDFNKDVATDNGLEEKRVLRGNIVLEEADKKFPFSIDAEDWGDISKVRKELNKHTGVGHIQHTDIQKVIKCVEKQNPPPQEKQSMIFGYDDEKQIYSTPSLCVTKDGLSENEEHKVSFGNDQLLSGLDMKIADKAKVEELKKSVREDFVHLTDQAYGLLILAFVHLPVIYPFMKQTQKFHLHVKGQTGIGKTYMLRTAQRFFGTFDDAHFAGWISTTNALQRQLFYFKDAVILLDDFKRQNLPGNKYNAALQLLQTSADGSTRHRLKSDSSAANAYYPKAFMMITAEDRIEKEASTISRTILLQLPFRPINFDAGDRIKDLEKEYCCMMPHFIEDVLQRVDADKDYYANGTRTNRDIYRKISGDAVTGERMAINTGMLKTAFDAVNEFYYDDPEDRKHNQKIVEPLLRKVMGDTLSNVKEERAGSQVEELIKSMLASDKLWLQRESKKHPDEENLRGVPIGYMMKGGENYAIAWGILMDEITKHMRSMGGELTHSRATLLEDLYKTGFIKYEYVKSYKMNGKNVRMIVVPKTSITGDSDED